MHAHTQTHHILQTFRMCDVAIAVEVIKAWDCAIANMRKGELARITCGPQFAYGERGMPPKIPPNATLIFEVELLDWKGGQLTAQCLFQCWVENQPLVCWKLEFSV